MVLAPVDLAAATAAFAASFGFGLRRIMLRPELATWCAAPRPVRFVLALASLVMAAVGVSIVVGYHATWRETIAYGAFAVTAVTMMANLARQGRPAGRPSAVEEREP